jgi:phenylpyruvate tautomerase PptA (4-oxalocrotonate tautomerase family)
MPIVTVHWSSPIDDNQKQQLIDTMTDTIQRVTGTPKDRVYVFFRYYQAGDVSNPGCPVVQINWTAQPERNDANKSQLIEQIGRHLATYPGVNSEKTVVIINDTPPESAGVGGISRAVKPD